MENKPTIYKNGNYWYYQIYNGQGKKEAHSTGIKVSQCNDKQYILELVLSELNITNKKNHSLQWLKDSFVKQIPDLADGTRKKYQQSIDVLIKILGSEFQIDKVKAVPHEAQFRLYCRNHCKGRNSKGARAQTINNWMKQLKTCFSHAEKLGHIPRHTNPFQNFKSIIERNPYQKEFESDSDLDKFFNAVDSWQPERKRCPEKWYEGMKRLARIYLYSGHRRIEVLETKRCDISLENNIMIMPVKKQRTAKKEPVEIHPEIRNDIQWFLDNYDSEYPMGFCKPDTITRYIKLWIRHAKLMMNTTCKACDTPHLIERQTAGNR